MEDTPIPEAARLGPTYQGWECDKCGLVSLQEVTIMDDGTAWHTGWGTCDASCHPVAVLVHDPRRWAHEAARHTAALAREVLRLREALATIDESHTTPKHYRAIAHHALFGGFHGALTEDTEEDGE